MTFTEITTVYSENQMMPIDTMYGKNAEVMIIKAGSYHFALRG
jgi:hypothetical protein